MTIKNGNPVWTKQNKPIVGQSPMDGVSDASFRYITDVYGHPDVLFTEFVSVEALLLGHPPVLGSLLRHDTETPTVAQLYGSEPSLFYDAAFIPLYLGYDGIDINMGCPDRSVNKRGAGAALINRPGTAVEIVGQVRRAVSDWFDGKSIRKTAVSENTLGELDRIRQRLKLKNKGIRKVPVTVKTRIGYGSPAVSQWIPRLAQAKPDAISVHGRTLAQRYTGSPDWDSIGEAVRILKGSDIKLLGNGNIKTREEAADKINKYGLDGVLIGRAALGNPWIFSGKSPVVRERLDTALEHCRRFNLFYPAGHFASLRKHLAWYMRDFQGSHRMRDRLMSVSSIEDVESCFRDIPASI